MSATGRFVTFEGGEGAGKSTQVRRLVRHLGARGRDVLATREPGGAPGAEEIRQLLVTGEIGRWDAETEALLHFAARRDHLVRAVWPALARGQWVVSDRFADSTMAYQGYAQGLGREAVETLHRHVVGTFAPDLTFILDVPVRVGLKRTDDRPHKETRYERMAPAFHEALRQAFLEIARREPGRCVVIDGTANEDDVASVVAAAVDARLGER